MSEANFNLPNIFEDTNMNDASIRQIKNYLYQLTEQLKYMMNNIDSDNMTASYQDSIKRAVEAAEKVDTMSEVLETNLGITNRVLNERATQIIEFNDLICKSLGLFKTEVTQEDGSVKYYMHDAETLETSSTIYTLTANGYAWTNSGWNDGNPVWQYGVDKDGNAIYKALSVYKLVAELITAGTIEALKYHSKTIKTFYASDYTQADSDRISAIIAATVTPTADDFEKYDFNGDGKINITDKLICLGFLNETYTEYKIGWEVTIDPSNHVNAVEVKKIQEGNTVLDIPVFSIGAGVARINGNIVADFVVEYGTTDGWMWEKYASGEARCWKKHAVTNVAHTIQYGSIYWAQPIAIGMPTGLFNTTPIHAQGNWADLGVVNVNCVATSTSSVSITISRATSGTISGNVSIEVIGTWK